ncbi:helix-turn-helix domain-containing protein [Streptomyces hyaluromycini]|uniref:helix-turn-helix domain-containing protein n=1 Tax=Streptomyces hyaluromycini TaxID=1377993 RepID=UPI0011AE3CCB|nr:helix-turn-helix transcriptional regulator [Streptomyces hyaluromycini]
MPRSASEPPSEPAAGRSGSLRARSGDLVDAFERRSRRLLATAPAAGAALEVLGAAAHCLLRRVPADVWCGVLLDPATLLDTGGRHEQGFPERVMPRLFEIEHAEQAGVDNIRALSRRTEPASLLSVSTGRRLEDSVYYRDILHPEGLADELRVALRDRGHCWGLLVLCRARGTLPFSPADVAVAARLSTPAGRALRQAFLLGGTDLGDTPDAPGLVILDRNGRIQQATPTARHWLGQIQESRPSDEQTGPLALQAVAARVRTTAHENPGESPVHSTRSRVRTHSGHWVTLHATHMSAPGHGGGNGGGTGLGEETGAGHTYVSVGLSQPGDLAAIVLDAYGLSARERQVAQRVLVGRSTTEIVDELAITEDTVQDHLKKIFRKADVHSRRELMEEVFFHHYLPGLVQPPLTTDGRRRPRDRGAGRGASGPG